MTRSAFPIGELEVFGDDTVEPGTFEALEPVPGHDGIGRSRGHVHGRSGSTERILERRPSGPEGLAAKVGLTKRQQVEGDERRRCRGGQEPYPRCGRMDPLQQRVEVEARPAGDHDLAVQHATLGQIGEQRRHELREVRV